MKYCPQCGVQNPVESKFCKSCGFNFLSSDLKHTQPEQVKEKKLPAVPKARKQFKISKKNIRITGFVMIFILLSAVSFLFKNQIAGIFNSTETENADSVTSVVIQTTTPEQLTQPVVQEKIIENVKEQPVEAAEEQATQSNKKDAVTSPQKFAKSKQAENLPEFKGLNDYFDYLGNPQNSYNEKATVQRQMIRENFTDKNFMVTVQTSGGVKTEQITINDLADEIRLNNNKVVIRTLKINKSNNKVTELAISYK